MIYKALLSVTHDDTFTTFNCVNVFKGDGENVDNTFSIMHSDPHNRVPPPEGIMKSIREWAEGKLVQDAFPYLWPKERELLLTGFTPEDWENMDDLGE